MGRPNLEGKCANHFNRAWGIVTDLNEGKIFTAHTIGDLYGLTLRGGRLLLNQTARMLPVVRARFEYGICLPKQNVGKTTGVEPESNFERAIDIVCRLKAGETFTSEKLTELYGVCRMRAQHLMREILFELPVQREINPGEHKTRYVIRWRKKS